MECEYQIKGTTLRIFLPQELDHHVSARLREEADLMVETHFIRTIIFDFSGILDGQFRHRCHSWAV